MSEHPDFELQRQEEIAEINSRARYYVHKSTGARVLSLVNDDENKVFGISFRTPPQDSTGVAHIMEHSVLCGSRKYPVKEPFVELLKGSLYTFLNAMTYPDKTCYPVASANLQDFYNLVDVYLDAVLHPRITPEIFQQEGWHYELEKPQDPLIYKGVVFNEMKGAYSSPDRAIYQYSRQSVFPDTLYAVDSGGDPQEIPNLTYRDFHKFHQTFYHPSNAYIFFYGDDDPSRRLALLASYLNEYSAQGVNSTIPLQHRINTPRQFTFPYQAGKEVDTAKKSIVTVNWLLSDTLDRRERLAVSLLDQILLGTPASPLWKALIDSGLGEDLSAHGLATGIRQLYFSTGLRGIAREDASAVEQLIFDTLQKLVEDGIPAETREAAINTVEFRLRENNTGSTPRGLSLMLRALSYWLYEGDPISPLGFEEPLQAIKDELARNPRLFEELIQRYLLQNQHRTTVLLEPDTGLAEREEAVEKARLEEVRRSLSDEQLQKIVEQTHKLRELQQTSDSPAELAKIPRLRLEDLEKKHQPLPLEVFRHGDTEVLYHDLFTSGILYCGIGFNLRQIPQRLLPYLRLFGQSLLELGTEKEDFVQLSERIGRYTGGISQWPISYSNKERLDAGAWLFLDGKSTVARTGDLLNILRDILLMPRLDHRERFKQILLEAKAGKENSLAASGHGVVQTRLGACFTEAGWFNEETRGIRYLFFLRKLLNRVDNDWPSVLDDLESLRRVLINRNAAIVNVTVDGDNWKIVRPQVENFLNELPESPVKLYDWQPHFLSGFEGLTIPAKVNYVGKAVNLYQRGYQFHGSALVINKFLRTSWLWNRIRVQGGAYGAFSNFSRRSGILTFLSYRDPNLLKTLENYDQTARFMRESDIGPEDLSRSIIGVIGGLDSYQLPDDKGITSMLRYLSNETDEELQQLRDEVFATTPQHFREFAAALEDFREKGIVVVVGDETAIHQATQDIPDGLKITKVL